MDPDATWRILLDSIACSNWPTAKKHANALSTWLTRGGFPPRTTGRTGLEDLDYLLATMTCSHVIDRAEGDASPSVPPKRTKSRRRHD
jgi:hypothetical protein